MMTPTHEFHESLALSEQIAEESWWTEVYQNAFPYFKSMERVPSDTPEQLAGIDRIIHLKKGGQVFVDEKVRYSDYDDILLEIQSSVEHQTPGWAVKPLSCDYIAYAFLPSRRCYFLPFPLLQRALWRNWDQWHHDYKKIDAPNRGYTTRSLAIPIDVLQRAISEASIIRWKGNNPESCK